MPQNPKGRNERGQEERANNHSQPRKQGVSNARGRQYDEVRGKRNDNRNYRSTILSSIDYDRNAE